MAQFGAPQEAIEKMLAAEEAAEDREISILEPNWIAYTVWRRCRPERVSMMDGAYTAGIAAQEIKVVCEVMRVRLDEVLLDQVQDFANLADTQRNRNSRNG